MPNSPNPVESDEPAGLVLSMRAKLSLAIACFMLAMGMVALIEAPVAMDALRGIAIGESSNGTVDQHPQETTPNTTIHPQETRPEKPVAPPQNVTSILILARMWNHNLRSTTLRLYSYTEENMTEIWQTTYPGTANSISLNDINRDGRPEIIATTGAVVKGVQEDRNVWTGARSLLIYEENQGTYNLVFNKSTFNVGTGEDYARSCMIDYFANGTDYLLVRFNSRLLLMSYDSGKPVIRKELPYILDRYGFATGDLNDDGLTDIVYMSGGMIVQENRGNGTYEKKIVWGVKPNPLDEIRIGDVDGDGLNEIVAVGEGVNCLCVYEKSQDRYDLAWRYQITECPESVFPGMMSIDIGDLDSDGINEMVVSSESAAVECSSLFGVSVWSYQPEMPSEGEMTEVGGYYRKWEDEETRRYGGMPHVNGMLAIRVMPSWNDGPEIVGIGGGTLYLARIHDSVFESEGKVLWSVYSAHAMIDAWPVVAGE